MTHDAHDLLTSGEVAQYLRVTEHTLRQQRWRGIGPPYVRTAGRVLYRREDVEQWLAVRRVDPAERLPIAA